MKPRLREVRFASCSMGRQVLPLLVVLLACLGATADVKASSLSAEQLDAFLKRLQRSVKQTLDSEKQHNEERQGFCKEGLAFLQTEGKRSEGLMEELRHEIHQLKGQKEEKVSLMQLDGQEVSELKSADESTSRALQMSVKARMSDAEERLSLRGASSSATHRFATALRQSCEGGGRYLDVEMKALALQDSSLNQAMEALHAAEALHGLDESTLQGAAVELRSQASFLQQSSSSQAEMPDLLSFFRSDSKEGEDSQGSADELGLLATKSRPAEPQEELLQAMPESQRPDVVALLNKMQTDGSKERSKHEAWCAEATSREKEALKTAHANAKLYGKDAAANAKLEAKLDDEIRQLEQTGVRAKEAAHQMLEDAANSTKGMDIAIRDQAVAAKVLKEAASGLSGLREQWWGHSTSNPVESAMRALTAAGASFEEQASVSQGYRSESSEPIKLVASRAKELLTALDSESHKLELLRDFYAARRQRSEENKELYNDQVKESESSLRSLGESCSKMALDSENSEIKAELHALHDAQMVFAGHRIQAKSSLRGGLSPMEKAALEMGVSMDD
mmetsp:Transcript_768/g.1410  ORF Transcript_768/g.1410 Transcript_768/m.1410 type:complete len:565 (+) Transcript_768:32-1726(+)